MMEATVAIWTKCDGVRDLVGTPIGQHLHVMHFEKWRAVVGEKRRLIGARFAKSFGGGQNASSLDVGRSLGQSLALALINV
jgi:hypothetical protein